MDEIEILKERLAEFDDIIRANDELIEQFPDDAVLKTIRGHLDEFKAELEEKINAFTATLAPTL